jgi:hypothetical protein
MCLLGDRGGFRGPDKVAWSDGCEQGESLQVTGQVGPSHSHIGVRLGRLGDKMAGE